MSRVLLLNPPCESGLTLRDFACGESTKADYYWAPIDLLVLSGLLAPHHDVAVLDAAVERLDFATALDRAERARPDVVFTLTAAVSLRSDNAFLAALKARTGCRVYAMGDCASFEPQRTLAIANAFDGAMQNFADPSLIALAAGDDSTAASIVLRDGDRFVTRATQRHPLTYEMPRHELFPLEKYRMPFSKWERSTTVMSAYGCPFGCTFCASGTLPWQLRELGPLVDELRYIKDLGLHEFYFRDFTFGPTRKRANEICDRLIEADLGLRWSAEVRIDVLDEPTLDRMRQAGCDVILAGIEVGDDAVAKAVGKRVTETRTAQKLDHARRIGIRTCGHFILGLPGESEAQMRRTIDYARALPLDYASFNLFAPRLGTILRDDLAAEGRVDVEDFEGQDVSWHANAFANVDSRALQKLHRDAILSFYFRPRQLVRLARVTPWSALARQGGAVLAGLARA